MIEIVGRTDRLERAPAEPAASVAPRAAGPPHRRAAASNRSRMRTPCTVLYSVVAAGSGTSGPHGRAPESFAGQAGLPSEPRILHRTIGHPLAAEVAILPVPGRPRR